MRDYSTKHKTVLELEHYEFDTCENCGRFKEKNDECICPAEPAIRIKGEWEVMRITQQEKGIRLLFKQGNELFAHVTFAKDITYSVGDSYKMNGWKRLSDRYHTLMINGRI